MENARDRYENTSKHGVIGHTCDLPQGGVGFRAPEPPVFQTGKARPAARGRSCGLHRLLIRRDPDSDIFEARPLPALDGH